MYMTNADWEFIHHFTKSENWGDWTKMERDVIYTLDEMRHYAGKKCTIHCGYEADGHTENSQHYKGLAVDCHFDDMSLMEQFVLATRFGWHAIGIYPDWNSPGLHLDMRDEKVWARWCLIGKYYIPIDNKAINYIIEKGV